MYKFNVSTVSCLFIIKVLRCFDFSMGNLLSSVFCPFLLPLFAGANLLCSKKPMIISFKWKYLVCKESSFNLPTCLLHPQTLSSNIILSDKSMTDALKARLILYIVQICSVILSKLLRKWMYFTHLQKNVFWTICGKYDTFLPKKM